MATEVDKINEGISIDPAINEMVEVARTEGIPTVWDRYKSQQPQCKFATTGVCCRLCHMGPCRITNKATHGICGATSDTIVARNLLREIAAGTAAHSDHGRMLVKTLKLVAEGKGGDYRSKIHGACENRRSSSRSRPRDVMIWQLRATWRASSWASSHGRPSLTRF